MTNLKENKIEYIVTITQNILLNTTFGLLGLLGFIISGLAVISGTIGHQVTHKIIKKKKFDSLLSILFSFYFIGRFIGILIVLFILSYFIMGISLKFNIYLYGAISIVLSYSLFFTVFFSVSLLGTCLNMFVLNYSYSRDPAHDNESVNIDKIFDGIRIDAVTALMNGKFNVSKEEFISALWDRIESDCPQEYQEEVKRKCKEYYSIED
ncbi:hypothetical protein OEA_28000 (plasmid) [Priestia megaterium NCT-2]|uniref:hypothetical protein n=1 Tax=Priestia megaterium TaxID=1404 RepID=UPI001013D1D8|nr:hypothetical protein [Priestia megaterium]AYE53513.2 hypothetical protein OEA_28000 [Priestia megaterium NCT-2]